MSSTDPWTGPSTGLSTRLPDIYRYAKTELSGRRLASAGALCGVFCLSLLLGALEGGPADRWLSLGHRAYWLQALALMVFGSARAGVSVSGERGARTWDFQRLTPMSSWQSALGRFFGAPALAYAIALFLLPLGLVAAIAGDYLAIWLGWELYLLCASFLALALGLFISAHVEDASARGASWAAPVLGLALLLALGQAPILASSFEQGAPLLAGAASWRSISFYNADIPLFIFMGASQLAFGAWALGFAACRIGEDYLEPRRAWALPLFILFIAAFATGFAKNREGDGAWAVALAALPAYAAALAAPRDEGSLALPWRAGAGKGNGLGALGSAPSWLLGLAAAALAAIAIAARAGSVAALVAIFIVARDLCVIQAARRAPRAKSAGGRPQALALATLAILHISCFALERSGALPPGWAAPLPLASGSGPAALEALAISGAHAAVGVAILLAALGLRRPAAAA